MWSSDLCTVVFFFKQKTAYEIYQCDWSSDVCSSDLLNSTVTSALNQGDTEAAKRVLGQYGGLMDGTTKSTLTKSINDREADTLEQTDTQSVLD